MSKQKKMKIFKYLHRDGDKDMSFFALVKRELSEWFKEISLARKQTSGKKFWSLTRWISTYHFGMFMKPFISSKTSKIKLNINNRDIFLEFRRNQSDLYILRENFVYRIYDYAFEDVVPNVKYIVDLGANIGLSSLYFQNRFPEAKIVCVEPVMENVKVLQKNAQNNNFSWKIERAAIQAKAGTVTLYPNEWWSSSTVTEKVATTRQSKEGRLEKILQLPTEKVEGVPIDILLQRNQIDMVDILKMDIEGAEEQSLLDSQKWLKNVRILIIEIHDKYVDRKKILNVLNNAGFYQIPGRKGPTDVFVNKEATLSEFSEYKKVEAR